MLCQPCQPVLHCLRKLIRSHGHYVNKSCMIPEYIISPLWNIFTNDEMLLLSASDIQSLSVSLMTALVTQKDLGQLQGENFQHKVRGTKFLSYLLLNHFFSTSFPFHHESQSSTSPSSSAVGAIWWQLHLLGPRAITFKEIYNLFLESSLETRLKSLHIDTFPDPQNSLEGSAVY